MRTFLPGVVVGVVAAATLTGTAYAASGGTFVLGRNNAASSQTLLTSSATGSPVLALSTRPGQIPLAVSAAAGKARNLDADRLDGMEASQLQRRVDGSCSNGSTLSAIGLDGSATCVGMRFYAYGSDMTSDSGVLRSTCPAGGEAVSGGFVLPQGVLVVVTAQSVYTDGSEEGYNARFQNLDGTPYTGSVNVNVVCRFVGVDPQAAGGSLRSSGSALPAPIG